MYKVENYVNKPILSIVAESIKLYAKHRYWATSSVFNQKFHNNI